MPDIRTTPGGGMEALGFGGNWETVPKAAQQEIERLRRMIRQIGGMADEAYIALNAADRWIERIDEVARTGPQSDYDFWAWPESN